MATSQLPKFPNFFQEILHDKGMTDAESIDGFLHPRLDKLPHPTRILNMDAAAAAVVAAIETAEPIIIWGDYDVDGVTSTSLLYLFFRALGVTARWYIPDRFADGYGVNLAAFEREFANLIGEKFLFITVDCGISDQEAINEITKRGGRAIVSDHHHLPQDGLPPGIIINPQQASCGLHGEGLAGVGVAFYLAAAVRAALRERNFFAGRPEPDLKKLLPLVAIGTLADVSFISKTNRILVRAGLEALQQDTALPGLRALLREAGIWSEAEGERAARRVANPITSEDVGFAIGPLLNAAGRLCHASEAARLLI
ncbi:MAG: DHH family phosphoesterase, partial [Desulfobulbaceae bacterium]|nr:DHH family phosphoesterase [Desulfobulbaceae bacterium]